MSEKRKLLEQETDMKAMREVSLCSFTVSVVCLFMADWMVA